MNQRDHPPAAGSPIAPSPVEGAGNVTLGAILRQARERQALTLDEVARRTRIPKSHLEALEQNSLAGIPPGMYQRAEVRAYADAVGLEPQLALVALGRAPVASPPGTVTPRPQAMRVPRATRPRMRLTFITVVALAFAIGAASILWPRQAVGPVGLPPTAVDDATVPTTLRPGAAADPLSNDASDAAAPTPSSSESRDVPTTFAYPDLRVITEPAGARVTVDGVGWGQSPLTSRALPAGGRVVRVTLDGYAAQERRVAVSDNTPRTTVRITLKPLR